MRVLASCPCRGSLAAPASGCGGATRLHLCRCARRCGGHGAPAVPPWLQVAIISTLAGSVQLAQAATREGEPSKMRQTPAGPKLPVCRYI
jgi:hypothetical protein